MYKRPKGRLAKRRWAEKFARARAKSAHAQKKDFLGGVYLHPFFRRDMSDVQQAEIAKDPTMQSPVTNKNTNAKHWFGM